MKRAWQKVTSAVPVVLIIAWLYPGSTQPTFEFTASLVNGKEVGCTVGKTLDQRLTFKCFFHVLLVTHMSLTTDPATI